MGYKKYSDEFKGELLGMVAEGSRSVAQSQRGAVGAGSGYHTRSDLQVAAALPGERGHAATERGTRRTGGTATATARAGDREAGARHPNKSHPSILTGGVVSRYRFIAEQRGKHSVRRAADVRGVRCVCERFL